MKKILIIFLGLLALGIILVSRPYFSFQKAQAQDEEYWQGEETGLDILAPEEQTPAEQAAETDPWDIGWGEEEVFQECNGEPMDNPDKECVYYLGDKYEITLKHENNSSVLPVFSPDYAERYIQAGRYFFEEIRNYNSGEVLDIKNDKITFDTNTLLLTDSLVEQALDYVPPPSANINQPKCDGSILEPTKSCVIYKEGPSNEIVIYDESDIGVNTEFDNKGNAVSMSYYPNNPVLLDKGDEIAVLKNKTYAVIVDESGVAKDRFTPTSDYYHLRLKQDGTINSPIADYRTKLTLKIYPANQKDFEDKNLLNTLMVSVALANPVTSQIVMYEDFLAPAKLKGTVGARYLEVAFDKIKPGDYIINITAKNSIDVDAPLSGNKEIKNIRKTINIPFSPTYDLAYQFEYGTGYVEFPKEAKVLIKAQVKGSNVDLQDGVVLLIDDITGGTRTRVYPTDVMPIFKTDDEGKIVVDDQGKPIVIDPNLAADVMPFANTNDLDFLRKNGYGTTFNYFNYGAIGKLLVGRKYAFNAGDVSGRFEPRGVDVVLPAEYVHTIVFDKYSSTYKPPADEVKPPTNARPPGLSDQDIASSGKIYVTMQQPKDKSHFDLGATMQTEARLDNFLLQPGDNKEIHYKFIIDGEYTACDKAHYTPASNQQVVTCLIQLNDPALKDYVGLGNHDIEVRVWRHADYENPAGEVSILDATNPPGSYFDIVDFSYGSLVWIEKPDDSGETFKINDNMDIEAALTYFNTLDGDKRLHIIFQIDDDTPLKGNCEKVDYIVQNETERVGCKVLLSGVKRMDGTALPLGPHELKVKVFRYNPFFAYEPASVDFCLVGPDGQEGLDKCAGIGTGNITAAAAASVNAGKPGMLGAIRLRRALFTEATSLAGVAQNVVNGLVAVAGSILILMLVINGIMYLTSAGNEEGVAKAKKGMIYAIIGLVIILAAYAILVFLGGYFHFSIGFPGLSLGG